MPFLVSDVPANQPVGEGDRPTARKIRFYATHSPILLERRLKELECEISAEEFVERAGWLALVLTSLLALIQGRRWLLAGLIFAALQAQVTFGRRGPFHDLLKRHGFRLRRNIEAERLSLRALRGDFFAINGDPEDRVRKCLDLFL